MTTREHMIDKHLPELDRILDEAYEANRSDLRAVALHNGSTGEAIVWKGTTTSLSGEIGVALTAMCFSPDLLEVLDRFDALSQDRGKKSCWVLPGLTFPVVDLVSKRTFDHKVVILHDDRTFTKSRFALTFVFRDHVLTGKAELVTRKVTEEIKSQLRG